jgi:uncharacterized membrane protein
MVANQRLAADANDQDKLMALLVYLIGWIVSLIILVSESNKNRPFQRFHAVNGLAFDLAWYAIFIILCILCSIVTAVTFGIGGVLYFCLFIPAIAWIVLKIWYAILAYQGQYFDIPIITDFCRQQRWI